MPLGLLECTTPLPKEANDKVVSSTTLHCTCVEFKFWTRNWQSCWRILFSPSVPLGL